MAVALKAEHEERHGVENNRRNDGALVHHGEGETCHAPALMRSARAAYARVRDAGAVGKRRSAASVMRREPS